jgi:hypothetical protein
MDVRRITLSEILAAVGGLLLAASLFLPWYATSSNPNARVYGMRGDITAWDAHTILRYLFLAAALAPIVLLWVIVRDHKLSWPRGEMTAVVAIAALGLAGYNGLIDRPGEPAGLISIKWGWAVSMVGIILMMVGSALRASEVERKRKPPGVL